MPQKCDAGIPQELVPVWVFIAMKLGNGIKGSWLLAGELGETPQAERLFPEQFDIETLAPALTAQLNCAYAHAAASHAGAWLAEHFQKQLLFTPLPGPRG